jgi:N-acetylneuraminate synthase/sialic acid synthase
MSIVAYTLGARVIEKHFTLNRSLKGTDHAFSLEPQGLKKMIRDLERTSLALGDGNKIIYDDERAPIRKMGKMIVAAKNLEKGHIISELDLEFRSPADGLPPAYLGQVIGKKLTRGIKQFSPIQFDDIGL